MVPIRDRGGPGFGSPFRLGTAPDRVLDTCLGSQVARRGQQGHTRRIRVMAVSGLVGLLERELETAHLQRAMDHSWHGVGRLVMIEGSAGIGKTSLVGTARELARAGGMNVRAARGAELEQSFAFGVVRQLFEPLLAAANDAQRGTWLAGAAGLAAPLFDARASAFDAQPGDSLYSLLHGLYWLSCNLAAERPLALLVDDAQWADEPSLAFLGFLARRLDELAILLVMAIRPVDPEAPPALVALFAEPAARVLKPRGLSPEAVERMLSREFGTDVEERFAHACQAATAGNPFLLGELVLELQERSVLPVAANAPEVGSLAPRSVSDAVLARLRRLSPAAPLLARAVAILGDGGGLPDAAALAGLDERSAIETAAAMRTGDLFNDEEGLTFAHPIIRAAIYQSMLPLERTLRHAQAASLLYDRNAAAERIAAQVLLADGLREPWVLDQLRLAADSALALGAPRNAVAYLGRALALEQEQPDRAALLARLGHAEVLAGLPEAAEHLEEAIRLTSDADERARVAIALAQLFKYTGRASRGVELLARLPAVADPKLGERVETEMLGSAVMSAAARELLAERLGRLQDRGGAARTERERLELVLLAFAGLLANRPRAELSELLARAGSGPDLAEDGTLLPPGVMTAVAVLTYCDEFDQAEAICSLVIERSRQRGSRASLLISTSVRAQVAYRRGELADALADATVALELAAEIGAGHSILRFHPLAMISSVAVEQASSVSELELLLDGIEHSLDRDVLHVGLALLARARLLLALGRPHAALDQCLEFALLPPTFASGTPAFIPWRSDAALIMHQLGDQQGALRLAEEELGLARAMGAPRAIGIALRTLGIVQPQPGLDLLRDAVRVLEPSRARLEHARALVDLGGAMRRQGERAAARAPLREGHDLAAVCGATKLAERAGQEIAATGARVTPAGLSGIASLTPSERRVAELAARGQTNREIAQNLFITEKTVETHLGHIYDKLGVRSRHKLRAALVEPDPRAT